STSDLERLLLRLFDVLQQKKTLIANNRLERWADRLVDTLYLLHISPEIDTSPIIKQLTGPKPVLILSEPLTLRRRKLVPLSLIGRKFQDTLSKQTSATAIILKAVEQTNSEEGIRIQILDESQCDPLHFADGISFFRAPGAEGKKALAVMRADGDETRRRNLEAQLPVYKAAGATILLNSDSELLFKELIKWVSGKLP
ncbi:MAG: hypothetical protein AAFV53_01400, partial [Myxococcota bacterium]